LETGAQGYKDGSNGGGKSTLGFVDAAAVDCVTGSEAAVCEGAMALFMIGAAKFEGE